MSERAQPIRPTQFMTTYGPGAILETLRGPRLIYSIEHSGLFDRDPPQDFEITEPALSQLLPGHGRIFRLPSNADYELEDSKSIYETMAFPRWSLCPEHGLLYRRDIDQEKACPKCPRREKWKAWEQACLQAVNFVLACPDGHLDDVPWVRLVHPNSSGCRPTTIYWSGSGGPLRGVTLRCPDCGSSVRLSDLYHREHHCTGCYPEEKLRGTECSQKARISQRGASDLFLPEVRTSLTLPQTDSELHEAFRSSDILPILEMMLGGNEQLSEEDWVRVVSGRRVSPEVQNLILRTPIKQRQLVAEQVVGEEEKMTLEEARAMELRALMAASRSTLPSSPNFELDTDGIRSFPFGSLEFRVTPVTRLRLVAAQIGYTRLSGKPVEKGYHRGHDLWFPGVEQFGEGLFLELLHPPSEEGASWRAWTTKHSESGEPAHHPLMVWWHTLSHRLIRALSIDSGYSAASVRERLYLDGNVGGLLLYAVQPGGDGTLGGLIALVPRFARVLRTALEQLDSCSNDPLCSDQKISSQRSNGAACYACALLSETSCEMRNISLDRCLLLETLKK
ncbi:MAG: DUF1998 domain-containing protein [Vulcanimicrobiota bacterium]